MVVFYPVVAARAAAVVAADAPNADAPDADADAEGRWRWCGGAGRRRFLVHGARGSGPSAPATIFELPPLGVACLV